jgi:hypothetical protein
MRQDVEVKREVVGHLHAPDTNSQSYPKGQKEQKKVKLQRAGFEPATPCYLLEMGSRYPTTGLTMLFAC